MNRETVNIFDYKCNEYDTGIPVKDVLVIRVEVVSGDEILSIWCNREDDPIIIDVAELSGMHRCVGYFDGAYTVKSNDLMKWLTRNGSVWGRPDYGEEDE